MTSLFKNSLIFVLLFTGLSKAAIQTHKQNSLGVVISQENPYTYKVGSIVAAFDINEGKGMVVRIQPSKTYLTFFEDILLCGSPVDMLNGKHNPLALIYKTVDSRMIDGIGCHELLGVSEIKTEKPK